MHREKNIGLILCDNSECACLSGRSQWESQPESLNEAQPRLYPPERVSTDRMLSGGAKKKSFKADSSLKD